MADSAMHGDGKSAVAIYIERLVSWDKAGRFRPVDHDLAGSISNFHQLRSCGIEAVGAGKNDTERFFCSICEDDAMGDDATIEIDVGYGLYGGVLEVRHKMSARGRGSGGVCPPSNFLIAPLFSMFRIHPEAQIRKGRAWKVQWRPPDRLGMRSLCNRSPRGCCLHSQRVCCPPACRSNDQSRS